MYKFLRNIHFFWVLIITTISVLLFNFLGFSGLIIYGLLIIYSLLFLISNVKNYKLLKSIAFYLMLGYYLYSLLAVLINGSYTRNGSPLLQLFLLSLISFFIRPSDEINKDLITIAKIVVTASIVMNLASFFVSLFTSKNQELINTFPPFLKSIFINVLGDSKYRIDGFGYHPNATASFCLTGIQFSLLLLTCENKRNYTIISIINIVLSILMIFIATASRTNMVSFFFFCVVYFVFYTFIVNNDNAKLKKVVTKSILIILLSLIFIAIIIMSIPNMQEFFFNRVLRISSLSTASGRDSVYKIAWELGKGHRLLGYNLSELAEAIAPHAHNMFLQILSFAGIPGLILFTLYFFYTIYIAGINFFSNSSSKKEKTINCFIFCYIINYLLLGLPESGGVDGICLNSICAQIIFASAHIIHYNAKNTLNNL